MLAVRLLYKDENLIIIEKPVGMPSQSDPSGDVDAMTDASRLLREAGERDELWLVHRLDRTVGGLIAFARNKRSAAELSRLVSEGGMVKRYFAACHGIADEGEYRDLLFKDSATSKAYVVKTARRGAKEARLTALRLAESGENASLLSVELGTGRFHQIRAQMSARSHPLIGDKKYGSRDEHRRVPALFAYMLSFTVFGKKIRVSATPCTDEYPWNLFDAEIYKKAAGEENQI